MHAINNNEVLREEEQKSASKYEPFDQDRSFNNVVGSFLVDKDYRSQLKLLNLTNESQKIEKELQNMKDQDEQEQKDEKEGV